ncbi:uncharacterized protein LOC131528285 [Onychostoma macrolepis]|uniref:uncharacterized protein LOC131528285 n=1 Tax=Onychostoma macrolepis TaxID=369639 RepID=UPI00272C9589|nr:uncharacterized protein LOC131528285 [Onychostoma macrolepis]
MNSRSILSLLSRLIINFLCSLPQSLCLCMFCLLLVSPFSLVPRLCCGFLIRRGGLRVRLLRSGLLLHLFHPLRCGGPLSGSGGLLRHPGGLVLYLRRRGGLLSGSGGLLHRRGDLWVHPGGLKSRLLRPGGLKSRLLRPGGLKSRLLRPGGLKSRLLRPGGLQSRLLRPGFLLCRLYLGPRSLRFHKDLALHPSPCSASAPPPSWIKDCVERLEAALRGGALSRIWSALPSIHHQRSLAHHMDFHTTHHMDSISHHPTLITAVTNHSLH